MLELGCASTVGSLGFYRLGFRSMLQQCFVVVCREFSFLGELHLQCVLFDADLCVLVGRRKTD